MVKEWQERQLYLPWRVMRFVEKSDAANQPEDNLGAYQWEPLKGNDALASQVLVVHPALAGYLPEMGFVADQGNTGFESTLLPRAEERTFDRVSYRLESYEEHIRRVLAAFEELVQPDLRYPAQALERAARSSGLDWLEGSVMRATWLVCLFHDVGKLNKRWQAWARTYQKLIGAPVEPGLAAAHTDREMGNAAHDAAEQAAQAKSPKPCHAGEGACATSVILNEALCRNEQLVRAALAAIARHHAPFAQEAEPYVLEPDAAMHIQATLRFLPEEIRQSVQLSRLKAEVSAKRALPLAEPDKMFSWLAYLLLARALRRADQEGTAQGSREG